MTSLGIYVQVPFCQTKCTYCNFHTGVVSSARFAPYVSAATREIQNHRELYASAGIELAASPAAPAQVDTVYIGGGTPSLLDPKHLANIMDTIRATFSCALSEVTLEADPETIEADKAAAWVAAGINRRAVVFRSRADGVRPDAPSRGYLSRGADFATGWHC
jgi:oxygen-independent coproporphyrinogen-3 oxidase